MGFVLEVFFARKIRAKIVYFPIYPFDSILYQLDTVLSNLSVYRWRLRYGAFLPLPIPPRVKLISIEDHFALLEAFRLARYAIVLIMMVEA